MSTDNRPSIEFNAIAEPLGNLLVAMRNLTRRDWPARYQHLPSARGVVRGVLAQAEVTYQAVVFLCADRQIPGRLPEYAIPAQPLARALLDAVFLVVFLFEDLPNRIEWYCKAGLAEFSRDVDRHAVQFGDNPAWGEWLRARRNAVLATPQTWEFSPDTEEVARRRPRWPYPGKMISREAKRAQWLSAERDVFLTYLHDWFYVELSWATHITFPGVLNASIHLLDVNDEDTRVAGVAKYRSDAVMTALTLTLALVSEVQIGLQFDRAERCRYVWSLLGPFWGPAQELYERRYATVL